MKPFYIVLCLIWSGMVAGHAADLSTNDAIAYAIDWPKNTPAITIPLEFRGVIPFVTCQLNGKTARLMVDTGVSTIFLYLRVA